MLLLSLLMGAVLSYASPYGAKICQTDPRFVCMTAGKGSAWRLIKHNQALLELVTRINRVNVGLSGTIAVPRDLKSANLLSTAPFPLNMPTPNEKLLVVDLDLLAWGAYDPTGNLVKWGPIAPGRGVCEDEHNKSCRTETGYFAVYNKEGANCISHKYPKPNGGAKMAYCSFFHGGQAIHAGKLPGRADSHGCVRALMEDAKWLNTHFLDIGTRVNVRSDQRSI
jgi:hypothetical protein